MFKYLLLFFVLTISCQNTEDLIKANKYPRMIGDLAKDTIIDDAKFTLCHQEKFATQYYAFEDKPYIDEKSELLAIYHNKYDASTVKKESGLIRIRFIINCKGETGRFRIISSDYNYKEITFDRNITKQLLNITKNLKGWQVFERKGKPRDYYYYLIFKMDKGVITEILP